MGEGSKVAESPTSLLEKMAQHAVGHSGRYRHDPTGLIDVRLEIQCAQVNERSRGVGEVIERMASSDGPHQATPRDETYDFVARIRRDDLECAVTMGTRPVCSRVARS